MPNVAKKSERENLRCPRCEHPKFFVDMDYAMRFTCAKCGEAVEITYAAPTSSSPRTRAVDEVPF